MKTLQNNYTTPEQSNRLLELGVPAWTADIMFDKNRRRYELIETEDESLAETQRTLFYNGGAIPHWTVCRLMEIFEICDVTQGENDMCCIPSLKRMTYMEYIMKCYNKAIEMGILDFSKLEE